MPVTLLVIQAKSLELPLSPLFFSLPTTSASGFPVDFPFKVEAGYLFTPSLATALVWASVLSLPGTAIAS